MTSGVADRDDVGLSGRCGASAWDEGGWQGTACLGAPQLSGRGGGRGRRGRCTARSVWPYLVISTFHIYSSQSGLPTALHPRRIPLTLPRFLFALGVGNNSARSLPQSHSSRLQSPFLLQRLHYVRYFRLLQFPQGEGELSRSFATFLRSVLFIESISWLPHRAISRWARHSSLVLSPQSLSHVCDRMHRMSPRRL